MNLIICFAILTLIYMIVLNYWYNSRSVYVLCDIVTNKDNENIHVISGIFTEKNTAKKHFDPDTMYAMEIPLNKFKKVTEEDMEKMETKKAKAEKDAQAFLEELNKLVDKLDEKKKE